MSFKAIHNSQTGTLYLVRGGSSFLNMDDVYGMIEVVNNTIYTYDRHCVFTRIDVSVDGIVSIKQKDESFFDGTPTFNVNASMVDGISHKLYIFTDYEHSPEANTGVVPYRIVAVSKETGKITYLTPCEVEDLYYIDFKNTVKDVISVSFENKDLGATVSYKLIYNTWYPAL